MTIVKKTRQRIKNRDKSKDYVDGPTLHRLLVEWYGSGKEDIPDKITLACMQIIRRLATRGNFGRYSYLDEMEDEARESVIVALIHKKYDITKTNPFAYFTTIAWNAFVAVINKEHKESYIKHKSLENHYQQMMITGEELGDVSSLEDINQDLISKFEQKKIAKKSKKSDDDLNQFLS